MTIGLQFLLAGALIIVSLLVFIMVRQIGILTRRLAIADIPAGEVPESLSSGDLCPVVEFESYCGSKMFHLPLDAGTGSLLFFASFSCANCRPILESIPQLPEQIRERLVIMILDTRVAEYSGAEIKRFGLQSVRIVEAYSLAGQFKIHRVPLIYIVDADNRIESSAALMTPEDLQRVVGVSGA